MLKRNLKSDQSTIFDILGNMSYYNQRWGRKKLNILFLEDLFLTPGQCGKVFKYLKYLNAK